MLYLAWRNITRRLGQSCATLLMVALAVFVATLGFTVFISLFQGIDRASERLGADIIVLPAEVGVGAQEMLFMAEPANIYLPANARDIIAQVPGVEKATPQFFTQTVDQSCCSVAGVTRVVGIDKDSDFVILPWVQEHETRGLGTNEVILGNKASEDIGESVAILGETFSVKTRLEPTGTSVDETIFMDIEKARTLGWESPFLQGVWKTVDPFTSVSAVLVKVEIGQDIDEVARDIEEAYPYVSATAVSGLVKNTAAQLLLFTKMFTFFIVAVLAITGLALVGRFSALTKERRKEIGFMRTVGFYKSEVVRTIVVEAVLVAVVGGIVGSLIGVVVAKPFLTTLHEVLALPGNDVAATTFFMVVCSGVLLSALLGVISSIGTAIKYARMDPYEALRKGDL